MLIRVNPAKLDEKKFKNTYRTLNEGIGAQVAPGMWLGFYLEEQGDFAHFLSLGQRRVTPSSQKMEQATPFDLASLTKVLVTAPLIGKIIESGKLAFDTEVSKFFDPLKGVEVGHLLSHTAGLVWWLPFYEELLERFPKLTETPIRERQAFVKRRILSHKLENPPGVKAVYSDLSFMLLGFLIEEIYGKPLDEVAQKELFEPMGLSSFTFKKVDQILFSNLNDIRYAATERCPWRHLVLQGQVHDDNCWAMGGIAGHAGLLGNGFDVLSYSKQIFNGFLRSKELEPMWCALTDPICSRTMGWDTPSGENPASGHYFSNKTVGHLGFTGTSLWMDLERKLSVALLTNRVHPSRDNRKIVEFRPKIHDALMFDLMDLGWIKR